MKLVLQLEENQRERGFWKINNSLLEKDAFTEKLKIIVDEKINKAQGNNNDPAQIWEIVKYEVAKYSQEQSVLIAKERNKKIIELQTKLRDLEKDLAFSLEDLGPQGAEVQTEMNEYY